MTYQAPTVAAALAEVKRQLGRDAVILNTRRLRTGSLLGLIGGQDVWEIQAAPRIPPRAAVDMGQYVPAAGKSTRGRPEAISAGTPKAVRASREANVAGEIKEIHGMVKALLGSGAAAKPARLTGRLSALRRRLIDQDVHRCLAGRLIGELRRELSPQELLDEKAARDRLAGLMARRIRVARPQSGRNATGRAQVVALVGPTGVGKTTTIAKLAAMAKLRQGKTVALITLDTYRIAGVDQLRSYAEIMDVPVQAVLRPDELGKAIEAGAQADLVLVDTVGRSQNNRSRLNDLQRFLEAARCDEVHLVVSAASSARVVAASVRGFKPLKPNRIIVTKLDEAETLGVILNLAASSDAAISYVTTGQNVPDDIASVDAARLARCILKGRWNAV